MEFGRKFVPFTVSVMSPEPANTVVGLIPVMVGTGAFTENVCAVDVPLLDVVTVTGTEADDAIRDAGMSAFNCVLLRYVVGIALPFQLIAELWLNPVPVIVRTKPGLPAVMLPGFKDEIVGAEDDTLKLTELEVLPPSVTVMLKLPAVVSDDAGITADTCVALMNVVVSAVPLKFTTEADVKLAPVTVSVVAGDPTVTVETDTDEMVGAPLLPEEPFPQPETKARIARIRPSTAARR